MPFYRRFHALLPSKHPKAGNIRDLLHSFEINGPHGTHLVLVHEASQMSLRSMDKVFKDDKGFDESFAKAGTRELLEVVDFLHTEVKAVHTG